MLAIIDWKRLPESEQTATLARPVAQQADIMPQVAKIIEQVKTQGDDALLALTQQYDGAKLDAIRVSPVEFNAARLAVQAELLADIQLVIDRISRYQTACLPTVMQLDSEDGIVCRRIPKAIDSVGLYVPGGTAPLVSTMMMLAIPAKIANCRQRVVCTPPNAEGKINPALLVTASLCGIDTIYKVGGAQAIAAMAYGTETVARVDKIFGPGNSWVTAAKQLVSRDRSGAMIDLPAGPSEVLVIADESANPEFVAADLLSQAEHGADSQAILLSTSRSVAEKVAAAVKRQLSVLLRKAFIEQSLQHSRLIVVDSLKEAVALANRYAPEHLILQVANPEQCLDWVYNAAAVFLGRWTPETMGDYLNGANHVLPTEGYANCLSGLSVLDFMKYISVQQVSEKGLKRFGQTAMNLAELEQLTAHKSAVKLRLDDLDKPDD